MTQPNKKPNGEQDKSLENWLWDAACSIRGAQEAAKYKDFILPLVFVKRLCDVYDDEINRIAEQVGGRENAFKLAKADYQQARKNARPGEKPKAMTRFYLPIQPENAEDAVWSVIRKLTGKIGEKLTDVLHAIAKEHPELDGIINRIDYNATTHGVREIEDDRLSMLIEEISKKRLGLKDVEPDLIGRAYEYLIRKFAENSGQSAGEFYTPKEVGILMARIMAPEPGMEIYDSNCGSGGLLIKCELELQRKMTAKGQGSFVPAKLYGQEFTPGTWAMANMNMIIHDMEGKIEIGDTFKNPKFRDKGQLKRFDRVVANPMWNQPGYDEKIYDADELDRFPKDAGFPGGKADWGWMQHIWASLKDDGRAAVVLDTGAASRGSGNANSNKEKDVRKWFVEQDLIEGVIYLPENLFYNTSAPGIIIFLNKRKPVERRNKLLLVNASQHFKKGDPKNYIPDDSIELLAEVFLNWREQDKLSRIVTKDEVVKHDYNISPSRYVHVSAEGEFRPLQEIIDDLSELESQETLQKTRLRNIFELLGIEYGA
ncbi:type I restriction-modification system subunit M [Methylomonas koyamae]|uniref:type I restriction-modification system subunit M n=1 Tax=Methylomonas koyamae TaxID=702114 RepID=UPI000BC2EF84|nr:type I restriction-modification system subunit M [Methylomonas koyamae]ATG91860.1 type I restriction enzyme subunit M [Methylomonas koyamae]